MKTRNIIVLSGVTLLLAFGGRALITNQDVPGNLQILVLTIITTGLAADPITEAVKRIGNKKEEDKA